MCSQRCFDDHIDICPSQVGLPVNSKSLKVGTRVLVKVSNYTRNWERYKGAWLPAVIHSPYNPFARSVVVKFENTGIGRQVRKVAINRLIPYSGNTPSDMHDWRRGDKVHVREETPDGEVWWAAMIVSVPESRGPTDYAIVRWKHQYQDTPSEDVAQFRNIRLANPSKMRTTN
jgi:hypothetical protein